MGEMGIEQIPISTPGTVTNRYLVKKSGKWEEETEGNTLEKIAGFFEHELGWHLGPQGELVIGGFPIKEGAKAAPVAAFGCGGEEATTAPDWINRLDIKTVYDITNLVPDGSTPNEIPEYEEKPDGNDIIVGTPDGGVNPPQPLFERTIDLYFENRGDTLYVSPENIIPIEMTADGLEDVELQVQFSIDNSTIDACFEDVCYAGAANVTQDPVFCRNFQTDGGTPDGGIADGSILDSGIQEGKLCCNNYSKDPEIEGNYIKAYLYSYSVVDKRDNPEEPTNEGPKDLNPPQIGFSNSYGLPIGAKCEENNLTSGEPVVVSIDSKYNSGNQIKANFGFRIAFETQNHAPGNQYRLNLVIKAFAKPRSN